MLFTNRLCNTVNDPSSDGIVPVRLFDPSRRLVSRVGPPSVVGIVPRRLFPDTSSDTNAVRRPNDDGRDPVRPTLDSWITVTDPPAHVTPAQLLVDNPTQIWFTGRPPLHCHVLYAVRLLAPVAAPKSHIMLSSNNTCVGTEEGLLVGTTVGDALGTTDGLVVGLEVVGTALGADEGVAVGAEVGVHAGIPPKLYLVLANFVIHGA